MDRRQECVFGEKCYRRNPHHFREYSHRHLSDLLSLHHPDHLLPHDSKIDRDQFKIFATIESEFNKNVIVGNKPKDKCEKTEAPVLNDDRSPSLCPG